MGAERERRRENEIEFTLGIRASYIKTINHMTPPSYNREKKLKPSVEKGPRGHLYIGVAVPTVSLGKALACLP